MQAEQPLLYEALTIATMRPAAPSMPSTASLNLEAGEVLGIVGEADLASHSLAGSLRTAGG